MRFGINTLDDVQVAGKTVLLRVDINQHIDRECGVLRDTSRIRACAPTIRELSDKGARVVLLAHQGSDVDYENLYSTRPHSMVLAEILGRPVPHTEDVCGPAAREAVAAMQDGGILMLENVRFLAEEQTLFERGVGLSHERQAETWLVDKLAPLADLYVCDAFAAAHRDQPSLCGFEQRLPSAMGRLFEEEFCAVSGLMEKPERLCVFVLGGAKIVDSFRMLDNVLGKGIADCVLTGGLVGQILLWANDDNIGAPAREYIVRSGYEGLVDEARALCDRYGGKIILPVDCGYVKDGIRRECLIHALPEGELVVDIGIGTAESYRGMILGAKTVFANGPMGVYERPESELGTRIVWNTLGETNGYTMIGGMDSLAAADKYGVTDQLSYICTAGGALIRFLAGDELPVVKALRLGSRIPQ